MSAEVDAAADEVVDTQAAAAPGAPQLSPQTLRLLNDPIVPTLLRMAWPNVSVSLITTGAALVETYWVSRLGVPALAAVAMVFPAVMLMQMISGGSMGGGIASAVARALGAGRRSDADALVLHAMVINGSLGLIFSALMLGFGRPLFHALGGRGEALDLAVAYSNIFFIGNLLLWLMGALSSVVRGAGDMLTPSVVTFVGVGVLLPLTPALIFGWGPLPALGLPGAALAQVIWFSASTAVFAWVVITGSSVVRLRPARLRWPFFADILRIGALGSISSLQTNITIAGVTAMVATAAGSAAVAGFGAAARLEFLLVSLSFGLGAPLVAIVGTNVGAGNRARAVRAAMIGAGIGFVVAETFGIAGAIFPEVWLRLFSDDPQMIAAGTAYLRVGGPAFGFFVAGLVLYFASQGAGKLIWPILGGLFRVILALGGGWLMLHLTGDIRWLFAAAALGLVVYGVTVVTAVRNGVWFSAKA